MVSSTVPEDIDQKASKPPIGKDGLRHISSRGKSIGDIITWAQEHLKVSGLSVDNMVILDERTARDETCLLISLRDLPDDQMPGGLDK